MYSYIDIAKTKWLLLWHLFLLMYLFSSCMHAKLLQSCPTL